MNNSLSNKAVNSDLGHYLDLEFQDPIAARQKLHEIK